MSQHKKHKKTAKASKKKQQQVLKKNGANIADLKIGLAVLVLTFIVFIPSLQNGFVNWDDPDFLTNNTLIRSLSNIPTLFTTTVLGAYAPLVFTTYSIEYQLFELNPFFYHLDNLLLHLGCVFLVFKIGRQLNLSVWGAGILALLFGIHPMRVESVAWVTERKDVLYGIFYLAAIFQYLKYVKQAEKKYLYYALAFFVPALFSKIQAVALPLSFLAIDYFFKRPLNVKLILEKIPFFILSLAIGLLGVYFLSTQDIVVEGVYSPFESIVVGTNSLMTYLIKWFVPYPLVTVYPYPNPAFDFTWKLYISLPVILGFLGLLFYLFKNNYRATFFGFLFFLVNVLFMLQVVGVGQGYLADRYTYIPYFGLFFILAYGFDFLTNASNKNYKNIAYALTGIGIVAFSAMTWTQNKVWKNSETLWNKAIYHYPRSTTAIQSRGDYYRETGQHDKAISDYQEGIALDKNNVSLPKNFGKLLFEMSRFDQALATFNTAIAIDATDPELYLNRGATYAALKQFQKAVDDFTKTLELDPNESEAYLNRSNVYFETRQFEASIQNIDQYLLVHPEYGDGWFRKGLMRSALGDIRAALDAYNKAIQADAQNGSYYQERARVYEVLGETANANADKQRAQQLGN